MEAVCCVFRHNSCARWILPSSTSWVKFFSFLGIATTADLGENKDERIERDERERDRERERKGGERVRG